MDDFLEVFFDKCDERCIAEKMLTNATLAASCVTIRHKICWDDGFMQRMTQAQFYLTRSFPLIMLITKVIEMVGWKTTRQKRKDAFVVTLMGRTNMLRLALLKARRGDLIDAVTSVDVASSAAVDGSPAQLHSGAERLRACRTSEEDEAMRLYGDIKLRKETQRSVAAVIAVDPASSWCVAMRTRMWSFVLLLAPWWRYIAGAFLALTQLST